MKQTRRIISILLSVLIIITIFTAVPLTAAAKGNSATSDTTGDCTWVFDKSTHTLTVSGNGAMGDSNPWEDYDYDIYSVVIEEGVTSIVEGAFDYQISLTSVSLPGTLVSIGDYAFNHTTISSIVIPDSVTSIGKGAFRQCPKLTSVVIPDGVTIIEYGAFGEDWELKSVTLPDTITSIGDYAFYGNLSLKSLTLPDTVTSIGDYAFSYCEELTDFTLPPHLQSLGTNAFYACASITCLDIPASLTSIGANAFNAEPSRESITVAQDNPKYDSRNNCNALIETSSNELLYGCKDTVIPDTVESIGVSAFDYCTGLKNMVIPDTVKKIGNYAFYHCKDLESITLAEGVTEIGSHAFYDCGMNSVVIPNTVTSIGKYAFGYEVTYGKGKDDMAREKKKDSFIIYGKSGSAAEIYADENGFRFIATETPKYILSGTTGSCIWAIDENNVLTISGNGQMGDYQNSADTPWRELNVRKLVINDGVTNIGNNAFSGFSGLEKIVVSGSVKTIGSNAFAECEDLKYITISNGVEKFDSHAFTGCKNLTSIMLPGSLNAIGEGAFAGCEKLTSVNIPDIITDIESETFSGCSALESISIPASVNTIHTKAFADCLSLRKISIPENVTVIEEKAFGYMSEEGELIPDEYFAVFGKTNSAAEKYATENGFIFTALNGITGDCTWSYNELTGTLTIGGNGAMANYENEPYSSDRPWRKLNYTNVIIEDGVTAVCDYAFNENERLKTVSIGKSVKTIGEKAFFLCGLEEVIIPDSVEKIGPRAFDMNFYLKDIVFCKNIKTIGDYAFADCGIKNIIIPGSVESIGESAFESCVLTSVTISNGVKSIGDDAFIGNEDLTSVTIPNSVTFIGEKAFGYKRFYSDDETEFVEDFTIYGQKGSAAQTYAEENNFNFVEKELPAVMVGDVNGDGVVNGADAGLLGRFTSGWKGYEEKIKNPDAADINGDGIVNGADAGILARYTSGWKQYAKYFS